MRFSSTVIFGAVSVCLLAGCSASVSALSAASRTHLDQQSSDLNAASEHLIEAKKRLASQADPHNAAAEVDAGNAQVQQAEQSNQTIRQDVANLSKSASGLRQEIDAHKNDLLGPRAIRIRNRVILVAVLLSIGAALLWLGPLLGGPVGGVVIVIGHLLTVFISPLFKAAWAGAVWLLGWIAKELTSLGNKAAAPATSPQPIQGVANAPVGSD